MSADKRVMPRFPTSSGVYVVYLEGSGAVRDLSLGGVFVVDPEPLAVGDHIQLELRFAGTGVPVRGIVRRSVPGQGMGIEFVNLKPDGQLRLKRYLANLATSLSMPSVKK